MDYNKSKNYLSSNDKLFFIGWVITAVGLLLFACSFVFGIYILPYKYEKIVCFGLIIAGLVLSYLPGTKRATAEELDQYINAKTKELSENIAETLEKTLKDPEEKPYSTGHYVYDSEGILIRRGLKDGEFRSSLYTVSLFAFKKSGIYILKNTFSLISDNESEEIFDIPYADSPKAFVEDIEYILPGDMDHKRIRRELVITVNGKETVRVPSVNSMAVDDIKDSINSETERYFSAK